MALTVIPNIVRSVRYVLAYEVPYELNFFYYWSVRASYTIDGVIYVFLQQRVRRLLWDILRGARRSQRCGGGTKGGKDSRSPLRNRSDTSEIILQS